MLPEWPTRFLTVQDKCYSTYRQTSHVQIYVLSATSVFDKYQLIRFKYALPTYIHACIQNVVNLKIKERGVTCFMIFSRFKDGFVLPFLRRTLFELLSYLTFKSLLCNINCMDLIWVTSLSPCPAIPKLLRSFKVLFGV